MKYLQTENGKEFYNNAVQELLNQYGAKPYSIFSKIHLRTLKMLMYCMFIKRSHYRWLTLLNKLVKPYNGTVHRTIGMKMRWVDERTVLKQNRGSKHNARKNKLKIDHRLRISKYKMIFAKGYTSNWTNKVFTVHSVVTHSRLRFY